MSINSDATLEQLSDHSDSYAPISFNLYCAAHQCPEAFDLSREWKNAWRIAQTGTEDSAKPMSLSIKGPESRTAALVRFLIEVTSAKPSEGGPSACPTQALSRCSASGQTLFPIATASSASPDSLERSGGLLGCEGDARSLGQLLGVCVALGIDDEDEEESGRGGLRST